MRREGLAAIVLLLACGAPAVPSDAGPSGGGAAQGGGAASGGGVGGGGSTALQAIGGTANGIDPALGTLTLSLGAEQLTLSHDGVFQFDTRLPAGAHYDVEVVSPPQGEQCTVMFGVGDVTAGADVSSVLVHCAHLTYSVGGSLVGLDAGGLTLLEAQSNQTVDLLPGSTGFAFGTRIAFNQHYDVQVQALPAGYLCTVDGGQGVITGDVSSIAVACGLQSFDVRGTVTGVADAGGLTLAEQTTGQTLPVPAGSTTFAFAQPIFWGTNIDVTVSSEPSHAHCSASGGSRLVSAAISDVAVTCDHGFFVGGTVSGLTGPGLKLREATTQQQLSIDADGGTAFVFPSIVPAGQPFSITVAAMPMNQSCIVSGGSGTSVADYAGAKVTCFQGYADLVVNEVSSGPDPTLPVWLELYNGTPDPKNLADYRLRTGSWKQDAGPGATPLVFALPDAGLAPGDSLVLSSKPLLDLWDNRQIHFIGSPTLTFFFGDGGADFVELLGADGGSVDAVSFGGSGQVTSPQWRGNPLALPGSSGDLGKSCARLPDHGDSNTAADFAQTDYPTPGGPNDAIGAVDVDLDGLPDSAEVPGGRYNGLPLYDWGARTGRRDVFVEVDWVQPDGVAPGTVDPGILPRAEALQRVHDVMAPHNLELHFDVGGLYDGDAGVDPSRMDLGGGNQTAFACTVTLSLTSGATSLYQLKAQNSDLQRRVAFHYVLFGNSLADVSCGGLGATGRSELPGNDVAITLGHGGLKTSPQSELNRLINWQSATLMHELGHNLGLHHGGLEDRNYKPNYLSVMNYLYQLNGLPQLGNNEGDRYYFMLGGGGFNLCSGAPTNVFNPASLTHSRFTDAGIFSLDYSDGSGGTLNLAALDETKGLGRDAGSVDWDLSTTLSASTTANIAAMGDAAPMCPRGTMGMGTVGDHDDWSAVTPFFLRTPAGSTSLRPRSVPLRGGADLISDHHTSVDETLVPWGQ